MITRDSALLWIGIASGLVLYLLADGRNPLTWAYLDWLKFAGAALATVSGKLASSPLNHSNPYKNFLS